MSEEFLAYYERELAFLRQLGAEFAEKYPHIAARLQLDPERCADPHVERLIEAFAFLTARIQHKLDDELPEVTEALLGALYPHYLAPIPSMSIVQFVMDVDQAKLQTGQTIQRGAKLSSKPVSGIPCRFQTCYPVTIWPVEVVSAGFEAAARIGPQAADSRSVLRLELRVTGGMKVSELREKISETEYRGLDRLRFFLHGEGNIVYALYEHLCCSVQRVEFRAGKQKKLSAPLVLGPESIRPVGFEKNEGMLPYGDRSFLGYRLLLEYYTFPEKFLFFDLCGLKRAGEAGFLDTIEVLIYCDREFSQEKSVSAQTFRLNCTPIVNLFTKVAEPIRVTHTQTEYRVVPDVRRPLATEIYSIDEVRSIAAQQEKVITFQPFYSFKRGLGRQGTFWYAGRRKSLWKGDEGTEVYLSLVDLDFNPARPEVEALTIHTTCTNRDHPSRLSAGDASGDFQFEGVGLFNFIRSLKKPTPSLRPALRRGVQWRLISHLSLNYLSLMEQEELSGPEALRELSGPEALREILRLYDFADSPLTRRQIEGITRVQARRVFRSIGSMFQTSFARGLEISVEFDEQQYSGTGVYLLAAVLERFFSLYTSVNSFTQMVATTRQREGVLKRWPPRAGEQILA